MLYRVVFDTQRNKRYITWVYYVSAKNQKEAKEKAFLHWHSAENPHYKNFGGDFYIYDKTGNCLHECEGKPHMFHTHAARIEESERDGDMRTFCKIKEYPVTWGKR